MMDWMLSAQNDVARLPALIWQQWWLRAGWSLVMAWLGAWLISRWTTRAHAKLAASLALGIWVWLPGTWGGAHWLGLAFQAPSVTSVLLCVMLWLRMFLWSTQPEHSRKEWPDSLRFIVLCGVALGWVLLLDTLGLWPGSLYNWGLGAAAPAIATGIVGLVWAFAKNPLGIHTGNKGVALVVVAIWICVASRLPSGNLFDALLDPWLWCALQIALIQQWRHRAKPTSA